MAQMVSTQELQDGLLFEAPRTDDAIGVPPAPPAGLDTALYDHDERLSRRDLRTQITRLEHELSRLFGSAFPRQGIEWGVPAPGGPRILSVNELERVRDSLVTRLRTAGAELAERTGAEQSNRGLIEDMQTDPGAYRWVRVSNEDIGERGCKHWHSRPRWGVFGFLLGWWRVKISSGCPLATGRRFAAST